MEKIEVTIVDEPEGFLICELDGNREWIGGETLDEAVETADNMGFLVVW